MRVFYINILVLIFTLLSCSCDPKDPDPGPGPVPDPDPNASISLDELLDMEDYTEGMIVDCRFYMEERVQRILLNEKEYTDPVSLDLSRAGYYRIEIYSYGSVDKDPGAIRLVVLDPQRGQTEWGLAPWTPRGVDIESIGSQEVRLVYPGKVPGGMDFPLVVVVGSQLTGSLANLQATADSKSFLIKRGVGSQWLPSGEQAPEALAINHRTFPIETEVFTDPPTILSGVLDESMNIPSGTYIHIPADLSIPSGLTLSIDTGAFVSIDPGVNINLEGSLLIRGTDESPVTFSCSDQESFWGGVIGRGSANFVKASHAIFGHSGYHSGGEYDWGHAHRQALFYSKGGAIELDHCYMIDHIGQIMYTESATLDLDHCLIQRARTGGQQNFTQVNISYSVFTDFPDDSNVFRDSDNDGLYLIECIARINSTFFMYAKDDGLDSGGGTYPGDVILRSCRFESIFHEGAALSGGNSEAKTQQFYSCVFMDCGQGLELGYSSKTHIVTIDSCLFWRNGIGIRYGDNYTYPNKGYLFASNSESLENASYDVWNMDREDWVADTMNMDFNNVVVTKANPMYPELKILD